MSAGSKVTDVNLRLETKARSNGNYFSAKEKCSSFLDKRLHYSTDVVY